MGARRIRERPFFRLWLKKMRANGRIASMSVVGALLLVWKTLHCQLYALDWTFLPI
jgi:hypothetical protein